MRVAMIALFGSLLLLPVAPSARAGSVMSMKALTVTLSADGEKKTAPKKAKKEKVEYMKSAAPPEPKK
jgi:hypothetical protein